MRTWISRRLRPLLAVSAVLGLAWAGWSQREAIASFDWSIDRGRLALAVGLFAVAPLLQGLTFALGLRRIGADGPAGALVRMWARSFLLRYEPSGVVGFAYRVTARERVGASTAQVVTVTGYEQLAVVVAGAAAAMAGFLGAGVHPPLLADVLFAAALVTAVAAVVGGSVSGGWLHDRLQARGIETAGPLRGRTLALMVALDAAGWVATGLGAWALARALGASAGLDAPLLLGAFALAWLLGVLVPLAPGGLGLREGSLILTLGAAIGAAPATALALALRLVSFAGELVAIAIAELAAVGLARRATTAPAPAPAPRLRPSRTAAAPSSSSRPTARPTPSPAWSSASRRPGSSSSWSTTRPPTGPASWLTRSPPTARGCTSFTAPARTASAWPIARA